VCVPWLLVQRRPFSSSSMPNEPSSKSSLTPSHVDFRTTTYSRQGSGVNPCLNPLSRSRISTSARRFSPVSTTSPRSDSIRASRNPPDRSQTYDHRLVADACFRSGKCRRYSDHAAASSRRRAACDRWTRNPSLPPLLPNDARQCGTTNGAIGETSTRLASGGYQFVVASAIAVATARSIRVAPDRPHDALHERVASVSRGHVMLDQVTCRRI
jgi:hypothetical protein